MCRASPNSCSTLPSVLAHVSFLGPPSRIPSLIPCTRRYMYAKSGILEAQGQCSCTLVEARVCAFVDRTRFPSPSPASFNPPFGAHISLPYENSTGMMLMDIISCESTVLCDELFDYLERSTFGKLHSYHHSIAPKGLYILLSAILPAQVVWSQVVRPGSKQASMPVLATLLVLLSFLSQPGDVQAQIILKGKCGENGQGPCGFDYTPAGCGSWFVAFCSYIRANICQSVCPLSESVSDRF